MMRLLKWSQKVPTEQSSAPLEQLLNSLNDVVLMLNQDHQVQFINNCWQTITGFAVNDTLNRSFADFIHPEDQANWLQVLQRLKPQTKETFWLRIISKQCEVHWCEIRLQAMLTDSLYPLSATLCDITPQVRDEQVRLAGHRSLQSLVARLPAMLYRARNNKSWTMEYVSNGCELITGYCAEKLLNQSQICLGSMIHPDDAGYVWDQVQQALHLQTSFDLQYRLFQADGQQITVQDKGKGLYSDSGMILGVEGIILQISDS